VSGVYGPKYLVATIARRGKVPALRTPLVATLRPGSGRDLHGRAIRWRTSTFLGSLKDICRYFP